MILSLMRCRYGGMTEKTAYPDIKSLVINMDNGPSVASNRTQFIKRITEFSQANTLNVHLVYYPPYHSKYNPVETMLGNSRNTLERNDPKFCGHGFGVDENDDLEGYYPGCSFS